MKVVLREIQHNLEGYAALARLHAQTEHCFFDDVEIDMRSTTWFDADMCAAFGAVLYRLGDQLNTIELTHVCPDVERILSKNGFLSHYGRARIPDYWGTTVSYQRFDVEDDRYFSGYIENEFIHRKEMPDMSRGLLKKFRESIFEIFGNAVQHSRTQLGIFSCGQFFPSRKQLAFSVADLGVGMRRNICRYLGEDLAPEAAIEWATRENNTTKRDSIPGGLGLKLLREFIDLNQGYLQIVSDAGYWRRRSLHTTTMRLDHPFPGTVVSVEINTADQNAYSLSSELTADDIF